MAEHVRKQLRAAAKDLFAGLVTTGSRVYVGRARQLAAAHKPSLLIYTRNEDAGTSSSGNPATLRRTCDLVLEGRVLGGDAEEVEDLLDDIASEIERKLGANATFDGLAKAVGLTRTETDVQAPGEHLNGKITMTFGVLFHTHEGAPDVAV
jgi:hypothetical protein